MQTRARYHFTPGGMLTIRQSGGKARAGKDVEKSEPHTLLMGLCEGVDAVESDLGTHHTVKRSIPRDPAFPLLGVLHRAIKIYIHTKNAGNVHSSIILL